MLKSNKKWSGQLVKSLQIVFIEKLLILVTVTRLLTKPLNIMDNFLYFQGLIKNKILWINYMFGPWNYTILV